MLRVILLLIRPSETSQCKDYAITFLFQHFQVILNISTWGQLRCLNPGE